MLRIKGICGLGLRYVMLKCAHTSGSLQIEPGVDLWLVLPGKDEQRL